jgi:cysteine desulfurase/selenocysteine lyase
MEPTTTKSSPFPIEKVRAAFPALEREVHGKPVAYLDSGASAQRVLASIQAVDRYERTSHSNVHRGSHTLSAEATAAYEGARATAADHLGAADRREVVFVRNATEAINLVARTWGGANIGKGDRIVLTEMEHHSNIVPWQQLAEWVGAEIDWVPVDGETGLLDMNAYAALLERGPKLVAVTHVSNVLGTENPLAEISRLAHEAGALVLADGAQAAPKMAVDVGELGVDFYAITGHKLYAPTGIGALWARLDLLRAMPPFLGGGSMIRKVTREGTTYADPPARFEAGTPAIAQAIGMASALRWMDSVGMGAIRTHEQEIAAYALGQLEEVPGLRVFGPPAGPERLGPVSFELDGVHAHDVSEILDRHGVAVRAGHHCAQPLMERLGIPATARASFGVYTTPEEIDRLVEGLHDARKVFGL